MWHQLFKNIFGSLSYGQVCKTWNNLWIHILCIAAVTVLVFHLWLKLQLHAEEEQIETDKNPLSQILKHTVLYTGRNLTLEVGCLLSTWFLSTSGRTKFHHVSSRGNTMIVINSSPHLPSNTRKWECVCANFIWNNGS